MAITSFISVIFLITSHCAIKIFVILSEFTNERNYICAGAFIAENSLRVRPLEPVTVIRA